jgi:hypothetical protein
LQKSQKDGKKKKQLSKKSILDKLIHWKETDPKLYWQILYNLRFEDDNRTDHGFFLFIFLFLLVLTILHDLFAIFSKIFEEMQYIYKWTTTSKDKLFHVLSERETIYEIVSFENIKFENTSDEVDSANEKLSNIFEKINV